MKLTDRNGTRLEVGQRVRVQRCVGPYGQTQIVAGTIHSVDATYPWVTLRVAPDYLYTVAVEPNGYRKFEDFEHGHETWTEILP